MTDSTRFEAEGRVEAIGAQAWVAADLRVSAEGGAPEDVFVREPARLLLADQRTVQLDLRNAQLSNPEASTQQGCWSELADGPLGQAPEFRPGPHVPLHVQVTSIPTGATVKVSGRVEGRRGSAEGYRESPAELYVRVERLTASSSPSPNQGRAVRLVDVAWGVGLFLLLGLSSTGAFLALALGHHCGAWLGAAWIAFSGTLGWRISARWGGYWHDGPGVPVHRWLPQPRTVPDSPSRTRLQHVIAPMTSIAAALFGAFGVPLGVLSLAAGEADLGSPLSIVAFAIPLGLSAGLIVEDRRRTRAARRFVRVLLEAGRSQDWSTVEGTLAGALILEIVARTEVVRMGRGRSIRVHVSESWVVPERLRVREVEVSPQALVWAGADGTWLASASELETWGLDASGAHAILARVGAPVASGAGPKRWASSGPGSLLLFTARGTQPLLALRRAQWAQRLWCLPVGLAAALACAVGLVSAW